MIFRYLIPNFNFYTWITNDTYNIFINIKQIYSPLTYIDFKNFDIIIKHNNN